MTAPARTCVSCGVPIRWEPCECADCRFGWSTARDDEKAIGRPRAPVDYPAIEKMLLAGASYARIADRLGCSQFVVFRTSRRLGLKRFRGQPRKRPLVIPEARCGA